MDLFYYTLYIGILTAGIIWNLKNFPGHLGAEKKLDEKCVYVYVYTLWRELSFSEGDRPFSFTLDFLSIRWAYGSFSFSSRAYIEIYGVHIIKG